MRLINMLNIFLKNQDNKIYAKKEKNKKNKKLKDLKKK